MLLMAGVWVLVQVLPVQVLLVQMLLGNQLLELDLRAARMRGGVRPLRMLRMRGAANEDGRPGRVDAGRRPPGQGSSAAPLRAAPVSPSPLAMLVSRRPVPWAQRALPHLGAHKGRHRQAVGHWNEERAGGVGEGRAGLNAAPTHIMLRVKTRVPARGPGKAMSDGPRRVVQTGSRRAAQCRSESQTCLFARLPVQCRCAASARRRGPTSPSSVSVPRCPGHLWMPATATHAPAGCVSCRPRCGPTRASPSP